MMTDSKSSLGFMIIENFLNFNFNLYKIFIEVKDNKVINERYSSINIYFIRIIFLGWSEIKYEIKGKMI